MLLSEEQLVDLQAVHLDKGSTLDVSFACRDHSALEALSGQSVDNAPFKDLCRFEQCGQSKYLHEARESAPKSQQHLLTEDSSEQSARCSYISLSAGIFRWQEPLLCRTYSHKADSTNANGQPTAVEPSTRGQTKSSRCKNRNNIRQENAQAEEQRRERNRIAAAKHRKKKRRVVDSLDANLNNARTANSMLRQQAQELRNQLVLWRIIALEHGRVEDGCKCAAIQQYNLKQAEDIVLQAQRAELAEPAIELIADST